MDARSRYERRERGLVNVSQLLISGSDFFVVGHLTQELGARIEGLEDRRFNFVLYDS